MSPAVREQYQSLRADLDRALRESAPAAEPMGKLGLWHHTYQLSEGAEAAYLEARRLAPEEPRWAYYLGMLYAALGRTAEARSELQAALAITPDDVPTLVRLAELELADGEIPRAVEHLEQALASDPECVRAMVALAEAMEARGDDQRAVETLAAARQLQPGSAQVRHSLARAFRRVGEIDQAAALLALAEPEASPNDARMRDPLGSRLRTLDVGLQGNLRRARAGERRGRPQAALQSYRRAKAADPDSIEARLGVARSLASLGRVDRSIEELRAALEDHPENPRLYSALASRLAAEDRREEARELFDAALAINPESRPALRGLGDLQAGSGDTEGALASFQKARSLGLTPELAHRHALALIRLGRHAQALRALEEDSERVGPDRSLELLLARLLAASPTAEVRDGEYALKLAREALDAAPGLDAAEVSVIALAELGDLPAAAAGQRLLVEAVQRAGRDDLLALMEQRARLFESGRPLRDPVPAGEALDAIFVDPAALEALFDRASARRP